MDERQDFGHWECDLVLGSRSKDEVLLTLVERKTRCSLIRKLPNKESASVIAAFRKLKDGMFRGCFSRVFLSITTDNGSEFSSLSELEKLSHTRIYYAHPYCSSDKGTNENHNGLFRRFLPKGKKIQDYPVEHISRVECWANTLFQKKYSAIRHLRSVLGRNACSTYCIKVRRVFNLLLQFGYLIIFLFHQNYSANGRFSPNIMVETCAHLYLPNMKSHAELQHGFINSNLKFLKCPKLRDSL